MTDRDTRTPDTDVDESLSSLVDLENLRGDRIHTKAGADPKRPLLARDFRGLRDHVDPTDPETMPSPVKVSKLGKL